jgi:prephenate dehydratase
MPEIYAIQGGRGSACHASLITYMGQAIADSRILFCLDAERTALSVANETARLGWFALESPIGTPVDETRRAFSRYDCLSISSIFDQEVHHAILSNRILPFSEYTRIYSHPIALQKHSDYLKAHFPNISPVPVIDTGWSAGELEAGRLDGKGLVIAPYAAATIFNLRVVVAHLPANSGYLTRFALVEKWGCV